MLKGLNSPLPQFKFLPITPHRLASHGLAMLSLGKSVPEALAPVASADSVTATPGRWFGLPAFPVIVCRLCLVLPSSSGDVDDKIPSFPKDLLSQRRLHPAPSHSLP